MAQQPFIDADDDVRRSSNVCDGRERKIGGVCNPIVNCSYFILHPMMMMMMMLSKSAEERETKLISKQQPVKASAYTKK